MRDSPTLLSARTDEALAELARAGSGPAFAALVSRHRPRLVRQARAVVGHSRAEDVVQVSLMRAMLALQAGTEVHGLSRWLSGIVRHAALDELRSGRRELVDLDETIADRRREAEFDHRIELHEALAAVSELPSRQRAVVAGTVSGRTPAEIASRLGISEPTTRQLLHRARVTLRTALHGLLPPPVLAFGQRLTELFGRVASGGDVGVLLPRAAVAAALATTAGAAAVPVPLPVLGRLHSAVVALVAGPPPAAAATVSPVPGGLVASTLTAASVPVALRLPAESVPAILRVGRPLPGGGPALPAPPPAGGSGADASGTSAASNVPADPAPADPEPTPADSEPTPVDPGAATSVDPNGAPPADPPPSTTPADPPPTPPADPASPPDPTPAPPADPTAAPPADPTAAPPADPTAAPPADPTPAAPADPAPAPPADPTPAPTPTDATPTSPPAADTTAPASPAPAP